MVRYFCIDVYMDVASTEYCDCYKQCSTIIARNYDEIILDSKCNKEF